MEKHTCADAQLLYGWNSMKEKKRDKEPKNLSINPRVTSAVEVYVAGHKRKGCRNISELTENLWISFLRKKGCKLPVLTK